jgi:ABC-type branched-subunit amino acid transport system substrate-binding protein
MSSLRRLLALLLALALVAAACGRGDDDDDDDAGGGPDDTEAEGGGEPEAGPGFDGTTITLGIITPTTGRAAIIGTPLTAGHQVYFDRVNAEGGIAGKYKVELVIEDNAYVPETTVQKYDKIKDDVAMFAQILGTPPTNAVLPRLKQDNIVAAPASLDAEWVREQNLLPVGGPYQVQVINAMDYVINEADGEGKETCILYQDDPYGEAGLEGLEFAGEQLDFEVGAKVTFAAGNTDWTAQINQLKDGSCELVLLVATPADAAGALGAAAQANFAPQWVGQSPTWLKILYAGPLKPYMEANFLLASEGPEWGDTSVEGMAQLLDDLKKYKPDQEPDGYFAFGYAQAWAVTQVLEAAVENGDLSREGIVEAMNGLDEITVGGLFGDYAWGEPADREPPRTSTVFKADLAQPVGVSAASEVNFTTDAAEAFDFEE